MRQERRRGLSEKKGGGQQQQCHHYPRCRISIETLMALVMAWVVIFFFLVVRRARYTEPLMSGWCDTNVPLDRTTTTERNRCPLFPLSSSNSSSSALQALRQKELEEGIQRAYYINLDKNKKRRQRMEEALQKQIKLYNRPLPFQRVPALRGDMKRTPCTPGLRDPDRCRGLAGIVKSNFQIMQYYQTSGITLVMEDDFVLRNLSLLEQAMHWIPDDWDILRFETVDYERHDEDFEYFDAPESSEYNASEFLIFRANFVKPCVNNCAYCGGAFCMVWRASSLAKIYNIWSAQPLADLDCRLAWDKNIKSYVINAHGQIGAHAPPGGEDTDIPKNAETTQTKTWFW